MTKTKNAEVGTCKLCFNDDVALVDSHIIPDFVFRWLKNISFNNYLRSSTVPNNRTQRGLTKKLLCAECDNVKFGGKLEAPFAETIFNPILLKKEDIESLNYDNVLLRFCVSVLWRVLLVGIDDAKKSKASNINLSFIISAMEELANQWREFLVDEKSSWIGQNVYFLRFGEAGLNPKHIGLGMHTYTKLTIDMGSLFDPFMCEPMVFAKFGPFLTFIPLSANFTPVWERAGISPLNENGGTLSFKEKNLPEHFKLILRQRSESSLNLFNQMSEIQKSKVLKIKNENQIKYEQSYEYQLGIMDAEEIRLHNPT